MLVPHLGQRLLRPTKGIINSEERFTGTSQLLTPSFNGMNFFLGILLRITDGTSMMNVRLSHKVTPIPLTSLYIELLPLQFFMQCHL